MVLVINPGSTSTKIAVYDGVKPVFEHTLRHSAEEIGAYPNIYSQKDFRKSLVLSAMEERGIKQSQLSAVIGRGGLVRPVEGGTYAVSPALLEDLRKGYMGQHASNLGGILAYEIANPLGIPSYIADPTVVDELSDVARISGHPLVERTSILHALNQKAMSRRYAKEHGKSYEDVRLVVVHMGGGISVAAHENGRIIDVCNALDGEGGFSPERSGAMPLRPVVEMCFSGKYTKDQIFKMIAGDGGVKAYLGTNSMMDVEKMVEAGDKKAAMVLEAFIYQIAKDIGSMAAVLCGRVDSVILTGGIAYSRYITEELTKRVGFIAPVTVYAGEDEMLALAQAVDRVVSGVEKPKEY